MNYKAILAIKWWLIVYNDEWNDRLIARKSFEMTQFWSQEESFTYKFIKNDLAKIILYYKLKYDSIFNKKHFTNNNY